MLAVGLDSYIAGNMLVMRSTMLEYAMLDEQSREDRTRRINSTVA